MCENCRNGTFKISLVNDEKGASCLIEIQALRPSDVAFEVAMVMQKDERFKSLVGLAVQFCEKPPPKELNHIIQLFVEGATSKLEFEKVEGGTMCSIQGGVTVNAIVLGLIMEKDVRVKDIFSAAHHSLNVGKTEREEEEIARANKEEIEKIIKEFKENG